VEAESSEREAEVEEEVDGAGERKRGLKISTPLESTPQLVAVPPDQRYAIELPTKCLVYGGIGFMTMYVVPRVFEVLGISR